MKQLKEELKKKKEILQELNKSRSKAYCSTVLSSETDVQRETEIEELEEDIEKLEKKLQS